MADSESIEIGGQQKSPAIAADAKHEDGGPKRADGISGLCLLSLEFCSDIIQLINRFR